MTAEDLDEIVQTEVAATERSVSNLDSICDTTLVGITFLLAGLATWGGFALGRIIDHGIRPLFAWPFLVLLVLSGVATTAAVSHIVTGLFPRQFYTEQVGETLVESPWNPLSRSDTSQSALLDRAQSTTPETYVEEFIDRYDGTAAVDNPSDFSRIRLRNLKIVAERKAVATGNGLAWFRLAVVCFLGTLVYGGVLVLLAT